GSDNFDLTYSSSDVTWVFYIDANSNGLADSGEEATNSGILAQAGTQDIIAVGTVPAGTADQTVDNITFTGTSVDDPAGTKASGDLAETVTVTAPLLVLVKTVADNDESGGETNSAAPGVTVTYTIVVQNWGTGEATGIVVTDVVPTNTTYVASSATGGAGTPGETGGSVTWNITTLAGDSNTGDSTYPETTLTFQVTVD
ncbi:MAG: DUF11 domain-containing protein, partial [Candidatus Marinimicrobia bacterium]|nr:DUF11 domain-containing protein [Candidatus Neomarinimicrobiota bacterium]